MLYRVQRERARSRPFITLVFVGLFAFGLAWELLVDKPRSDRHLAELEDALAIVGAPAGASLLSESKISKNGDAVITRTYSTSMGLAGIDSFYCERFTSDGWVLVEAADPPRGDGGFLPRRYVRGNAHAAVRVTAPASATAWQYTVTLEE